MPDRTSRENLIFIGKVAFILKWVGHSRGLREAGPLSYCLSKLTRAAMRRSFVFEDWSRKDTTLMQMVGASANGFDGDKGILRDILCEVGILMDEIYLGGLELLDSNGTRLSTEALTKRMMERKKARERLLNLTRLINRTLEPWDVFEDFLRGNIGISINNYDRHTYLTYHKVLKYIRDHIDD